MQTYDINITVRREPSAQPMITPRHRKRANGLTKGQRRTLRLMGRLTLAFTASMAAARLIIFGLEVADSRTGAIGGEIVIPAFIIIFVTFGWQLRGWIADYKKIRKELDNECTTESAQFADATSIRENAASAFRMSRHA